MQLRAILAGLLVAASANCAAAEAIVTGSETALTIEARDSSLRDVLAELGEKFGLRLRNVAALDRRVDGTYAGSLRDVLTRLLRGCDYVMRLDRFPIEVIVLGVARPSTSPSEQVTPVALTQTRRRSD